MLCCTRRLDRSRFLHPPTATSATLAAVLQLQLALRLCRSHPRSGPSSHSMSTFTLNRLGGSSPRSRPLGPSPPRTLLCITASLQPRFGGASPATISPFSLAGRLGVPLLELPALPDPTPPHLAFSRRLVARLVARRVVLIKGASGHRTGPPDRARHRSERAEDADRQPLAQSRIESSSDQTSETKESH